MNNKRCELCDHSRAAHTDGTRCALCGCTSQPRTFTQQPLAFRSTLPVRAAANPRKR